MLTKKGFYDLLMICVTTMHLKIQKKKILSTKYTKTKNTFLHPLPHSPDKYMCLGLGNPSNCVPAPRQPKKAGFWVSSSSPFLREFVPEMNLCIGGALGRGGVSLRKHENYSFPSWSKDSFVSCRKNIGSFFSGLLFMFFFILKQNHCCLSPCLGKESRTATQTWALVSVRYVWSVFLPVICMGEAKNCNFSLCFRLTGKSLLNSASNCLMEIRFIFLKLKRSTKSCLITQQIDRHIEITLFLFQQGKDSRFITFSANAY